MRSKKKNLFGMGSIAVLFILTSLYLSLPEGPITVARAQTGSLLRTVNLPASAKCSMLGTSVAVVPGLSLGLLQHPILLVTSCYGPSGNTLHFLDPTTDPATVVRTIVTTSTPPLGWGSLALRGDKGDLLGCGNNSTGEHAIYAIDISPFNATADGTATFMFNGTAGFDICDGVAWDASDNTIFQSPDVSSTIYHYSETGTLLGTLPSPAGCPNSGVAVGGASLFAACNGVLTVHQMNKGTGVSVFNFPSSGQRTEDLECDPVSFSAARKDAMWSKDAFTDQLFAFEIPAGTCGFAGGPPPATLAACSDTDGNGNVDNDGDSLCDNWEATGIDFDGNGSIDFTPPGANVNQPDVYIEVDWMNLHQPNADSINDVIASFAAHGVALHVQVDEEALPHNNAFVFEPCTAPNNALPNFDTVKNGNFGTAAERALANSVNVLNAKRFVYHYSLFVHSLSGLGGTSGCAEIGSNDFVVSLGGWGGGAHPGGTRDHQAGTFMHELGHNLGLLHGGDAFANCKPNYLSVMSYTRQLNGVPILGRPLDYSNSVLLSLNESNLNDAAGLGGPALTTVYGPTAAAAPPVIAPAQAVNTGAGWLVLTPANQPVDWNQNGDFISAGVNADINRIPASGCGPSAGQVLTGFNDWANLKYNFRASTDFADGVHLTVVSAPEITLEQGLSLSPDTDGDGVVNLVDNCPLISNTGQEDSNGDGVGDVCSQQDPGTMLQALIDSLNQAGLNHGVLNSLRAKLQNAQKAISQGRGLDACNLMSAFLNEVKAQSGKALPSSLADGLTQDALQIKLALQCGIANGRRAIPPKSARPKRVAMIRPAPRVTLKAER